MEKQSKVTEVNAEVMMVNPDGATPRIRFTQFIKAFGRLGKEIKISPKSHVCFNNEGYKAEYFVPTVSICIGIGNDHTAELIMTQESYEALRSGEEINITTTREYKEKYG